MHYNLDRMAPSTVRVLVLLLMMSLGSCIGPYIQRHTVMKTAPPFQGEVELRVFPRGSTGQALFRTEVVVRDPDVFMSNDEFMRLMRRRAAQLGANVLVVQCGHRISTGAATCVLTGYRE